MTQRLTGIGNTQKKTEMLSNSYFYYKHIGNPVALNIAERAWISVAANRLRSLKCLTRDLSLSASVGVDVSSAPQQATGSIVNGFFPVYAHFRFTHSYRVAEQRERQRPVILSFLLLRMQPNVN